MASTAVPSIVATTRTAAAGSTTSFSISSPATAAGQQMFMVGWTDTDGTAQSFPVPSGWTVVSRPFTDAQENAAATSATGAYGRIYTRLSTAADVGATYTPSKATARGVSAFIVAMDQPCELDTIAWAGSGTAGAASTTITVTAPTATSLSKFSRQFRSYATVSGSGVSSWSTPSGYTVAQTNAGTYCSSVLHHQADTTPGATGTAASTATASGSTGRKWASLTFTVRPLPNHYTRFESGYFDGMQTATDSFQSSTPVAATGVAGFTTGTAARIDLQANGGQTPGTGASANTSGAQRCEMYPNLNNVAPMVDAPNGLFGYPDLLYFGLAVKLDAAYPVNATSWQLISQWKNDGSGSPPIDLKIGGGLLYIDGNNGSWRIDICQVVGGGQYNILLGMVFAETAAQSAVSVWVNGTQFVGAAKPTGAGLVYVGQNSYWKIGSYRDAAITQASTIWFGAATVSRDFASTDRYLTQSVNTALVTPEPPTTPKAATDALAVTDAAGLGFDALVSDFSTIDPWSASYGNGANPPAIVNGRGRVPCEQTGGNPSYAGFAPPARYRLRGARVAVRVPTVAQANGATAGQQVITELSVNSVSVGGDQRLWMAFDAVTGQLSFQVQTGYFEASPPSVAYSPTQHLWWGIRDDGTNVVFETSADGVNWTPQRTAASPAWTATVDQRAVLGSWRQGGANDYAEFDDFNIIPTSIAKAGADAATVGEVAAAAAAVPVSDPETIGDVAAVSVAVAVVDPETVGDTATVAAAIPSGDAGAISDVARTAAALVGSDVGQVLDAQAIRQAYTATDPETVAESQALAAASTVTELGAMGESQTVGVGVSRTDAALLVDQATTTAAVSLPDAATLADSAGIARASSSTDPETVGDVASVAAGVAVSDAAAVTDSAVLDTSIQVAGADSASVADTASTTATGAAGDTGTVGDTAVLRTADQRAATDTGTATEAAQIAATATRPDTASLGEAASSTAAQGVSEAAQVADGALVGRASTVSDPETIGDTATLTVAVTGTDPAALADTASTTATASRPDAAVLADQSAVTAGATVSDPETIGETQTLAVSVPRVDTGAVAESARIAQRTDNPATMTDVATVVVVITRADALAVADLDVMRAYPRGVDVLTVAESRDLAISDVLHPLGTTTPTSDPRATGRAPVAAGRASSRPSSWSGRASASGATPVSS